MPHVKPREERPTAGLALMVSAVFCFTMIDTSAKWLAMSGLAPLQIVFARYLGHFVAAVAVVVPRQGAGAFVSASPRIQALRSVFLLLSTVFNFLALSFLPITVTTTIMFAGPIVVSLLSMPILHEPVGARRLGAVLAGFLGVLIVIRPWGAQFQPAMLLSVAALGCASLYFVLTRYLAGTESNATSQLWASGLASLVMAPLALRIWEWPDSAVGYGVLICIGLFGAAGHAIATLAHRFADASALAPVFYAQILFATLAGLIVFDTAPTAWTLAGGAVIVASGIYIWRRERERARAASYPRPI